MTRFAKGEVWSPDVLPRRLQRAFNRLREVIVSQNSDTLTKWGLISPSERSHRYLGRKPCSAVWMQKTKQCVTSHCWCALSSNMWRCRLCFCGDYARVDLLDDEDDDLFGLLDDVGEVFILESRIRIPARGRYFLQFFRACGGMIILIPAE